MILGINYEAHLYSTRGISDSAFEQKHTILGDDVTKHVKENRKGHIQFDTKNKTFHDLSRYFFEKMGFKAELRLRIVIDNNWYIVNHRDQIDSKIEYIQNITKSDEINIVLLLWIGAGDILRHNGYRYYFNSNEDTSHHKPHIHVDKRGEAEKASIEILTGKIIIGNISNRNERKFALDYVKRNKNWLAEQWNLHTNGLSIDLEHDLEVNYDC